MSDKSKSVDVLGLGSIGEAVAPITTGVVDGAAAFFGRICLPAAEEFGLMLRDRISLWRARNAAKVAGYAQARLATSDEERLHAPPRLVAQIVEHGSWADDAGLHAMWGGLLASACSVDGKDESNLIFVDLLERLTSSEARLLRFLCLSSDIRVSEVGWIHAYSLRLELPILLRAAEITDAQRLDRELEHLRHLGLVHGGFERESLEALVTVSPLGLQMFARCEGCRSDPGEFLRARPAPKIVIDSSGLPSRPGRQSHRRVLVVDDEPSIVKALAVALSRMGHEVTTSTSGESALKIIRGEPIDVLITDLNMPDVRGDVVFERACSYRPELRNRTLFITGDITEGARKLIAACGCPLLRKPFQLRDLTSAVEGILGVAVA